LVSPGFWFFQSHQDQPPVAFRLNRDNITAVNPRLLPGPGGTDHLTAAVNGGMHELKDNASNAYMQHGKLADAFFGRRDSKRLTAI
jgi:hypothetical protein